VNGVAVAMRAEFFVFQPIGLCSPVLGVGVVAALAITAS
jgi:hypothetical protein